MASPGATNLGSSGMCHTFSQQSFQKVTQPWVAQSCETLLDYFKRKTILSESTKKNQHHSVAIFTFRVQPSPATHHKCEEGNNAMVVSVNTTVQLSVHAHLHFYSRERVTHLRRSKERELIFPTPLSHKATRLNSIVSVSYPTCMGTTHLTILTKAIHSYTSDNPLGSPYRPSPITFDV